MMVTAENGKKTIGIPDEHSSDDDRAEFNKARGVPDNSDDYNPIDKSNGADNTFFDKMKPIFKKANLTQENVDILLNNIGPVLEEITGKKITSDKESDEDFSTRMDSLFGGTKETDLANAKLLMTQHTPESMKLDIASLGNKELAIMASVLKNVRSKYINEDGGALDGKGNSQNNSKEELRIEGQKQINIAQDITKSPVEREAATLKAQEIYKQHDAMK